MRFVSLSSHQFYFRGRIVRQLGSDHYLVEDNTGLKPRVISASRIESCCDVGFERPRGEAA